MSLPFKVGDLVTNAGQSALRLEGTERDRLGRLDPDGLALVLAMVPSATWPDSTGQVLLLGQGPELQLGWTACLGDLYAVEDT